MKSIFIIAGGDFDKDFATDFIKKNLGQGKPFIIACDKGFEHVRSIGLVPDITIGDFDSISKDAFVEIEKSGTEIIRLNPIKDDTDTEAALRLAAERGTNLDEIYILGATGKRLDHFLGNISLLGLGLKLDRQVTLVDSYNYIRMIEAGWTLEIEKSGDFGQFGKYVSVFPYGGKAYGVDMTGFKYNLSDATLEGFNTLTVSNEITEDYAYITLKEGYLIVCESRD